jgi:hypothetical protein
VPAKLSAHNIRIDKVLFDKSDVAIENTLNSLAFSVKEGIHDI